jgi:hypothetical protein
LPSQKGNQIKLEQFRLNIFFFKNTYLFHWSYKVVSTHFLVKLASQIDYLIGLLNLPLNTLKRLKVMEILDTIAKDTDTKKPTKLM